MFRLIFFLTALIASSPAFAAFAIPDATITLRKLHAQVSDPKDIRNCTITTSVSSNALTIAIKDNAGNTPTTLSPCKVSFRSSTLTTGTYSSVNVTAATTLVISSGSTLGMRDAEEGPIYVYYVNNGGTVVLGAVGMGPIDEGTTQTSTAEGGAGAADTSMTLYTGSAVSTKAVRLAARLLVTETTAGTWASNVTEIALPPFKAQRIYAAAISPTAVSIDHTAASFTTVTSASVASSRSYKGLAVAPGTANDFSLKIPVLPKGCYNVFADFIMNHAGSGFSCTARLYDGTNTLSQKTTGAQAAAITGLQGLICYTSAQTNIEFKVQIYSTSSVSCKFGASNGGQGAAPYSITLMQAD